jgi:predicted O-methyltransferase YrrM
MKNEVVVFTDKNIHFKNNPRSIVMDISSKSLIQMYSYIVCQNGGNVLDVGFGMGFSANEMSKLANHYTCIEINPQIYEKAKEWAKNKSNVTIIFGDWVDIIPKLNQKFDGIFMDTHDDINYEKFEEYCNSIANENCILSIFNYFTFRDQSKLNRYEYKLEPHKFTKITTSTHTINWTYFKNGNFEKGDGIIKFKSPISII